MFLCMWLINKIYNFRDIMVLIPILLYYKLCFYTSNKRNCHFISYLHIILLKLWLQPIKITLSNFVFIVRYWIIKQLNKMMSRRCCWIIPTNFISRSLLNKHTIQKERWFFKMNFKMRIFFKQHLVSLKRFACY